MVPFKSMRRGQSILEYLLIFAVVSAAILGMQVYAKRGIQAVVKTAADQMSPVAGDVDGRAAQALGMRQESGDTQQAMISGSVLAKDSGTTTLTKENRTTEEKVGGEHATAILEGSTSTTGTSTSRVVSTVK